ncbi:MAG TPA: FAD-linked oxidase C-terminal domain-containing protein, partial [Bacillota bacterium]
AATSLAGQTVGRALVLDFTRHMNRILDLDVEARTMTVEPGVVADHLNLRAGRHGLRWAPDPSTSNRATVGGMIGNNSSGAHSIRYGMTADCLVSLRVVLAGGQVIETRPLPVDGPELAQRLANRDPADREASIYREVLSVGRDYAGDIAARYPNIPRNASGYDLRKAVRDGHVDLTRLICGSEGTLAIVTRATLRLEPRPSARALAVLVYDDLVTAMEAVEPLRGHDVSAIELIDRALLDLALRTPYRAVAAGFPEVARAVLAVEVEGDEPGEVTERAKRLAELGRGELGAVQAEVLSEPAAQRRLWAMRKAAVPIMYRMPGDAKPVPFIEDMAVPPATLPEYVRGLQALFAEHDVDSVIYAHAGDGCLHIRPVLNLKDPDEVEKMARLAADACRLVLSLGGSMTGEHGDGLSRSQWIRAQYGERLYEAFRRIKQAFDPQGILNPGKIVADDADLRAHLRYGHGYRTADWTAALDFSDQGSFQQAVEFCNGCGACRKATGSMCPTFQATNDEIMSTRGRANLLRGALGGRLDPDILFTPEFKRQVLDYCIACKACRVECPSGVDMARIKAEVLYHFNRRNGVTLRQRLVAETRLLFRLGSLTAPLSNRLAAARPIRRLAERVAGIDRRRPLPRFARTSLSAWMRRRGLAAPRNPWAGPEPAHGERVLLFADCFNDFSHPQVGTAAVELLQRAGVPVRLAPAAACCGRPAISEGLLDEARTMARRNTDALRPYVEAGWRVIGLEPSCTSVFKHELRELLGFADTGARLVAEATRDVMAYLADLLDRGALEPLRRDLGTLEPLRPDGDALKPLLRDRGTPGTDGNAGPSAGNAPPPQRLTLYAHCHQKSLGAHTDAARVLEALTGLPVDVVDAGCCGMAGSFGYKREHYDFSARIAERARQGIEASGGMLLATGTSCTTQFADLYGWQALHPLQLLARGLDGA